MPRTKAARATGEKETEMLFLTTTSTVEALIEQRIRTHSRRG